MRFENATKKFVHAQISRRHAPESTCVTTIEISSLAILSASRLPTLPVLFTPPRVVPTCSLLLTCIQIIRNPLGGSVGGSFVAFPGFSSPRTTDTPYLVFIMEEPKFTNPRNRSLFLIHDRF
ncbi:hypothetical protein BDP81DRAFT_412936 [Colletotrichum phormii]|uniref:Uncharacterized protein n=1 Tax=Colletotrichum phormii TaxID=359342 RepID=A0AAJ0A5S8_9PEZI|nr:uncharacterized protein BDP81DRAFT_412936 [Colletotrichum phormii]KAK1655571.1 hypothetical protein BDP81DRAFT_412936 [Colletotrichum phormii]